jgi:hypothetical protein
MSLREDLLVELGERSMTRAYGHIEKGDEDLK